MTDVSCPDPGPAQNTGATEEYRVLARKYRPTDFSGLIGQDVLVKTLSNAIATNRLAQAWMLTGVRGVGKTTTARIIARALNCIGPDGNTGPTVTPCGLCTHCQAIAADRHVDVTEMDAASRTGVGDMRDILEGVRYRPASARYRIYIIDEVHMLSGAAFNALLKTLEEPPAHVKFIFATTEIRKVPVTVLSRCQRFDLRRIDVETLSAHFQRISGLEGVTVDDEALALIARAADGSVRDGLSLLDRAIAHCGSSIHARQVRDMLGLADRGQTLDLLEIILGGNLPHALETIQAYYAAGADPAVILEDMQGLTHWLTRLKATPNVPADHTVPADMAKRGTDMASRLSMGVLTRTWQMLLKIHAEVRTAAQPLQALEMGIIRMAYAADLPAPADVIAKLQSTPDKTSSPVQASPTVPSPRQPESEPSRNAGAQTRPTPAPHTSYSAQTALKADPVQEDCTPVASVKSVAVTAPETFEKMVALVVAKREAILGYHLEHTVHPVFYEPGRLEFRPKDETPSDLAGKLARCLEEWTGMRWIISISKEAGEPTLFEKTMTGVRADPLVRAALEAFPTASIGAVRDLPVAPTADDTENLAQPES
ncbi:DNA polymerase III subunit gamma/tau [Haematospirillum jordaniae]|uniref:DNA polymerase III subunit gamma/tau n=1 Tax=Haematospirillum jordaniae TaxID=1549855 RepID=A0A143DD42_9PROT|nr:DNA polymerase III subunit gamma/tau [Haematospirillum jordaniae]AMW34193.1 DNA polymerase III subunit gamma/tau [Haematospirillum jordaniae]NKD45029.1 DNA polymerase III subunit gamma/tau [Haematospirillum jordaniae]NKD57152.1 DNA polymerase III subunit gamma/tau [Haematospirillum jordaniae]NKD59385.1 DNA polymerase III subunit gamma/tau [Haematospirillum jordaniae]NKD67078.1 DNA polymerase III subunit gamma/tau [Haematospirillum jordaniae]